MIIARAADRDAVAQLIAADPFTRDGLATYDVYAFIPTRGRFALPLRDCAATVRGRPHLPTAPTSTSGHLALQKENKTMNHTELHERDLDVRTERTAVAEARGAAHFARLMARRPEQALRAVRAASPPMYDWLVSGPFAGPLSGSEARRWTA